MLAHAQCHYLRNSVIQSVAKNLILASKKSTTICDMNGSNGYKGLNNDIARASGDLTQ